MRFDFDENAIKSLTQEAVADFGKDMQAVVDRVARSHAGKPVAVVKEALRREWRRALKQDLRDPDLSEYAATISGGDKIKFDFKYT